MLREGGDYSMSMFEEISKAAAAQACRHHYCLRYLGNEHGVDKVIEFRAPSVTHAIEYALQDPARRTVEIREDESFVCMLGREPN
jgi:hypothetical protein